MIFPISPGRYRVLADQQASGLEHPAPPTLEQVQVVINRRGPPGLVAFDPIWLATFKINGRKVAHYRWGRAFLLGDAAHVHSPAGGQGINTGMQDAFNLAWKLALVIRETCGAHLLDSYSPERSRVGDEVLKAAGELTTVGTLKNPVAQTLRNLVGHVTMGLSPVRHAIADTMTEVAIGYPESPLNGPSLGKEGPRPGERVVPVAGQAPVGSGGTPLFALFADRTAASADLLSRFKNLLDPDIRRPSARAASGWCGPTAMRPAPLGTRPSSPATSTPWCGRAHPRAVRARWPRVGQRLDPEPPLNEQAHLRQRTTHLSYEPR